MKIENTAIRITSVATGNKKEGGEPFTIIKFYFDNPNVKLNFIGFTDCTSFLNGNLINRFKVEHLKTVQYATLTCENVSSGSMKINLLSIKDIF